MTTWLSMYGLKYSLVTICAIGYTCLTLESWHLKRWRLDNWLFISCNIERCFWTADFWNAVFWQRVDAWFSRTCHLGTDIWKPTFEKWRLTTFRCQIFSSIMANAWPYRDHGNRMVIAQQQRGCSVAIAWQQHCKLMETSWQSHGSNMAIAWQ